MSKPLLISAGDPDGIGPEVTARALGRIRPDYPVVVLGRSSVLPGAEQWPRVNAPEETRGRGGVFLWEPESEGEDVSFLQVRTGALWALEGRGVALVTAPISKETWRRGGIPYDGHTELLKDLAGCRRVIMSFWSPGLKTLLYTTHLPLAEVCGCMQPEPVRAFLRLACAELRRWAGRDVPLLVPGLNPHAGEGGWLGRQEQDVLEPVLRELQEEGLPLEGLWPPDTVFLKALGRPGAWVVSWYHDQGLIPFKLLHFREGVNLTLGLPFVRTSPDHGTARDIAGQGKADESSMEAAIRLAWRMGQAQAGGGSTDPFEI